MIIGEVFETSLDDEMVVYLEKQFQAEQCLCEKITELCRFELYKLCHVPQSPDQI